MAPFPSSSYASFAAWVMKNDAFPPLPLAPCPWSTQANPHGKKFPLRGKHWEWQMWLLEPRQQGVDFLILVTGHHRSLRVRRPLGKAKTKKKERVITLHGISYSDLGFSTVRNVGMPWWVILESDESWVFPKVSIARPPFTHQPTSTY